MKRIFCILAALLAAALFLSGNTREKARAVFNGNVGFDDFSRSIEVSIAQNPAAAMVFGIEDNKAVQVFAQGGLE